MLVYPSDGFMDRETGMTTDSNIWISIEKSYQFYAYVFTLYVICMGIARWFGQTSSRAGEEKRRKSAGLPVAECFSNAEQGFTYASLFQGGLLGVVATSLLMTYVLVLPVALWGWGSLRTVLDRPDVGSILMYFPVITIAILTLAVLFLFCRGVGISNLIFATGLIAACVAATTIAYWKIADKAALVMIQLLAVAAMSLFMSFLMGIATGLRRAKPEASYPLVSVELQQGAGFDRVWLYERTDSDYRFLSATGANYVVPAANVTKITKIGDQS